MKILHIISGDLDGGAARGAYWLHRGLASLGVESKVLTNSRKTFFDKDVINVNSSLYEKLLNKIHLLPDYFLPKLYTKRFNSLFSTAIGGYDFTKHFIYNWADIINLHWINQGFLDIRDLRKVKKPIVWTMRDMWPMTGGCHVAFALGCVNYEYGCGNCPLLDSRLKWDLSRYVFWRKTKFLPRQIVWVGISSWLTEMAKKSKLLQGACLKTIPNNIELENFFPVAKSLAREVLGINTSKKVILLGSGSLEDIHKGLFKFLQSEKLLDSDRYFLCFFGELGNVDLTQLKCEHKSFGFLYDSVSLRLLYSAADVFVAPSLMDAFGKTLVEAMACGTPVVCFDATGPRDIVDHQKNGYKAKPYEPDDLANGIKWVLNSSNYEDLCTNARKKAVEKYDNKVVAQQYVTLYREILQSGHGA